MDTTPPPPPSQPAGQPFGQYPGGAPGPWPSAPPAPPRPSGADGFFDAIRRAGIVRSEERWIGGVAGGLALRAGIDPLVVRALFVLTSFLGGLGLVAYAVAWALLPEQRDGRIHVQQLFRGHFDAALIGIAVVFFAGLSSPDRWLPWWGGGSGDDWWTGLFWLGALVLVVVLVTTARRDDGPRAFGGPTAPPTAPPGWHPATPTTPPPPAPGHGTDPAAATAARPSGTPMDTTPPSATASATTSGTTPPPAPGAGSTGNDQSGWTQGPGGWAYAAPGGPRSPYPGPPAPPSALPSIPRARVLGPGSTTVSIVLGLGLLALAGFWYAQREGLYDGPVLLAAGSVLVVLAGIGIVVAGLRGRHSGSLGAVAVLTTLVLIPLAFFSRVEWVEWSWDGTSAGVGEIRNTPTTVAEAERGYSVGAGEVTIDLTELPLRAGEVVEVPISVGAGEVTVRMPDDGAFAADVQVFAGEVRWLGDEAQAGVGQQRMTYESPAVQDGDEPQIVLDISVGAGAVSIEEE